MQLSVGVLLISYSLYDDGTLHDAVYYYSAIGPILHVSLMAAVLSGRGYNH